MSSADEQGLRPKVEERQWRQEIDERMRYLEGQVQHLKKRLEDLEGLSLTGGTLPSAPIGWAAKPSPITGTGKNMPTIVSAADLPEITSLCAQLQAHSVPLDTDRESITTAFTANTLLLSSIGIRYNASTEKFLDPVKSKHWTLVMPDKHVQLYQLGQSSDEDTDILTLALVTEWRNFNVGIHPTATGYRPLIYFANGFDDVNRTSPRWWEAKINEHLLCNFEQLQQKLSKHPNGPEQSMPWNEIIGSPGRFLGVAILHPFQEHRVATKVIPTLHTALKIAKFIKVPVIVFDMPEGSIKCPSMLPDMLPK